MRIELIEIPCTARWYTDALINLTMMCSFLLVTQLDTRKKSRNKMESSFILNKSLTSLLSTFRNLTPNLQKKKEERRQKKLRPERENSVSLGLGVELWLAKKSGVRRA